MDKADNIEMTDTQLMAFLAGELGDAERRVVMEWISMSPSNQQYFDELAKTWELTGELNQDIKVDTDQAWNAVTHLIQEKDEKPVIELKTNRRMYWGIAASILIVVGAFSLFKFTSSSGEIEIISHVAEYQGVIDQLEDGSVVTLNANTRIDYPEKFADNERRMALNGEAFFEIERDETKPFIIDLPDLTHVKVLGTSFNIKSNQNDSLTTVYVNTGKVEFGTSDSVLILVPGETGIYNHITGKLRKTENPSSGEEMLYWKTGELDFDSQDLVEVIAILNAVFDEKVVLECEEARQFRINSKLKKGDSIRVVLNEIVDIHHLGLHQELENGKSIYFLTCR